MMELHWALKQIHRLCLQALLRTDIIRFHQHQNIRVIPGCWPNVVGVEKAASPQLLKQALGDLTVTRLCAVLCLQGL